MHVTSKRHMRPVAADGAVAPDYEISPAEFILHLFVTLLNPVTQTVQPHNLGQRHLLTRQIRGQVPRGDLGQLSPKVWCELACQLPVGTDTDLAQAADLR